MTFGRSILRRPDTDNQRGALTPARRGCCVVGLAPRIGAQLRYSVKASSNASLLT